MLPLLRRLRGNEKFNLCPVNFTKFYGFEKEMTNREYLEDEDAEEPDDFVISLTSQVSYITLKSLVYFRSHQIFVSLSSVERI